MKFYKYPESEPLETDYYLCSMKNRASGNYKFCEVLFVKGVGFKRTNQGMDIVAFTSLTAEEAAKNAHI